jgi:benzylsuccinate CoA-transferase BbsE subunit
VTLNLQCAEGRQLFVKLAAGADVVVDAFAPGYLASLGLGYDQLSQTNPALIVTSITGFGQTGPHSGWQSNDLVALATSGVLTLSGFADRPPYRPYPSQAVYCAGIEATNATLLALLERESSGRGQWIDVSAQDSLLWPETAMRHVDMQKRARARTGTAERALGTVNETADGYLYGMLGLARGGSAADLIRWMEERHGRKPGYGRNSRSVRCGSGRSRAAGRWRRSRPS